MKTVLDDLEKQYSVTMSMARAEYAYFKLILSPVLLASVNLLHKFSIIGGICGSFSRTVLREKYGFKAALRAR